LLKNPHFYHTFFVWVPCNHFNFFSLPSNWFFSITMFVLIFVKIIKRRFHSKKKITFLKQKFQRKTEWMMIMTK
jgi:hypothetical protein